MGFVRRNSVLLWFVLQGSLVQSLAEPIDLFPDAPVLASGFLRIGAWNLRHINLEDGAEEFLPGTTRTEDFAILIETYAKAILDLGLDVAVIVEHQPRSGEANHIIQLRDKLASVSTKPWRSDETEIEYDPPFSEFSHLQFATLWDSSRVTINPDADVLLDELRQPRDEGGNLEEKRMRAPWLVPIRAGNLDFDLIVLHLKSGGASPQAQEVEALAGFIKKHQSKPSPRHLIVCGDWNIRPDTPSGRGRLRTFQSAGTDHKVMRVLTIEDIPPSLDQWEALGTIAVDSPTASSVPFTHFNAASLDTLLDHVAISMTLNETFDHPIQVRLADGTTDLQPGIQIAFPLIPEPSYLHLTDHLPVVLLLRTDPVSVEPSTCALRISAAKPNPSGNESQFEAVHIHNSGATAVPLANWKIADARNAVWALDASDGSVPPGGTLVVLRRNRPMGLNNDGDTIVLRAPDDAICDTKGYSNAGSDVIINFN